jgi:membrane protease YdiL (CAAX protease family)
MFESAPLKPASTKLLLAALLAYSLAHLVNNTVLATPAASEALAGLQRVSGGWIEPVLVRSQVVLASFLAVVLLAGRRRFSDLGWRPGLLLPALLGWLGAWLALQLGLAAVELVTGGGLAWHPSWSRGAGVVLGGVLAQACGHALAADTAFRGFFLPELRGRASDLGGALATGLALAGSALLFGLAHLPTRVFVRGSFGVDLAGELWGFFTAGLALGVAYLATRNLFLVVALHVLWNDPAPLVQVPGELLYNMKAVVCASVIASLWLRNRRAVKAGELEREDASLKRAA